MNTPTNENSHRRRGTKPETEARYGAALELYRTTLPVRVICTLTQTPLGAFSYHISRYRRELMFARHGIEITPEKAATTRLRTHTGQTAAFRAKYGEAIRACDDIAYIEYNVSQIANIFRLNPTELGNQSRNHYPEILERCERERHRLGVNDNQHRGVKPWCREQYATAVEHLRTTDDLYSLSYHGRREYLLFYYKDPVRERADKREWAKSEAKDVGTDRQRRPPRAESRTGGEIPGNPPALPRHDPDAQEDSGCNRHNRHRPAQLPADMAPRAARGTPRPQMSRRGDRQPLPHEALPEIHRREVCRRHRLPEGRPTAEVAKKFGLHPETFWEYVREHEPELAARLGKTRLADGKQVLARCVEKYGETVRLYETTTEPLRSIVDRLGLQYNSVGVSCAATVPTP